MLGLGEVESCFFSGWGSSPEKISHSWDNMTEHLAGETGTQTIVMGETLTKTTSIKPLFEPEPNARTLNTDLESLRHFIYLPNMAH